MGQHFTIDQLIFLDTETTGIDAADRLCQVAYKYQGIEYNELFKPEVAISIDAMSISHITNEMVASKDSFEGSEMQNHLNDLFQAGGIMVAHNAPFDVSMLERDGVASITHVIDTLKVAKALDLDAVIPKYNMQYLRYYHKLEITDPVQAHDALGDIRVLEKLFLYYFDLMMQDMNNEYAVIEKMIEISSAPTVHRVMPFGKYKDQKIEDVLATDKGYLTWLLQTKRKDLQEKGIDDDGWIHTIEHYFANRK